MAVAVSIKYSVLPSTITKQLSLQPCNCVKVARQLNNDLPYGLFSLYQKKRIINSTTPTIGATVILNEGYYSGHLATVVGIDNNTITIIEGNYKRCKVTIRTLPKNSYKIIGYYV